MMVLHTPGFLLTCLPMREDLGMRRRPGRILHTCNSCIWTILSIYSLGIPCMNSLMQMVLLLLCSYPNISAYVSSVSLLWYVLGIDGLGGVHLENVTSKYPGFRSFFEEGSFTTKARCETPTVRIKTKSRTLKHYILISCFLYCTCMQ